MSDDRETLNICPLCHGHGELTTRFDTAKGYRVIFIDCFLCNRLGSIDSSTLKRWIDAGKPLTKEDYHG